jgi:Skp family chaperone for outer membrane proteins
MLRRPVAMALAALAVLAVAVDARGQRREAPDAVPAAPDPPIVIVVDFQSVVRNSAAARSIQDQINDLRRGYQQEFGRIEEELRAAETELTEARGTLSQEDFIDRRRAFEERVVEAQRAAQARRAALDEALNRAMDEVRQALVEVIAEIARESGADLVIDRAQVVLVDSGLEVSEEALAELDARLPDVEVMPPPPPSPSPPSALPSPPGDGE